MTLAIVFKELDAWIIRQNQEQREEGSLTLRRCTIRVLGQSALLEANVELSLAATNDVDVYANYEYTIQQKFEQLLRVRGKLLDPVGHEAWMPKETTYLTIFDGNYVCGQLAAAEYVLLSKALKAPQKNRALIVEYLAKGPSETFHRLAKKISTRFGAVCEMNNKLQQKARDAMKALERKRRDPRFVRVMGKLVNLGLIQTNMKHIVPYRGRIELVDALWAGEVEPRILELLPALVLKKPGMFRGALTLPLDLDEVATAIRHNRDTIPFRGVPPRNYLQWIPEIGHHGKHPSLLKSFRFTWRDLERLRKLQSNVGTKTEIETLRYALDVALIESQQVANDS